VPGRSTELDPSGGDQLYRASRAPIGGVPTLFSLGIVDDPEAFGVVARVMSTRVLYLGWRFWTQVTEDWASGTPKLDPTRAPSGPALEWDSTRGLLEPPADLPNDEFHFWRRSRRRSKAVTRSWVVPPPFGRCSVRQLSHDWETL